ADEIVFGEPRHKAPELPYEISDPIKSDPAEKRFVERYNAERHTGMMVTALIPEPKGCGCCRFCLYRWCSPFWGKPSAMMGYHNEPGTRGLMCNLAHNGIVTVCDLDDDGYKPDWCPLVPVEEVPDAD
ncbi:hypothetical protein, partial [Adlercreutzia caecimuris]|uniref:hypothetical protein n=1 Tax=Adlercreutzia caecimuris TaxID=671266 RepID=UPI003F736F1C